MTVATGLDRLVAGEIDFLRGKRVGLLANPASIDRAYVHAVDRLAALDGVELVRLFGPEHGLRGTAQDMIAVNEAADERTGVPVVGLYGSTTETLAPTADHLAGLDALVFDLQDVGARYYTYIWTLLLAMRACADAGVAVVVLDRPNPLGGAVEGPPIEPGFESFVGLSSLPNRHGMTAGEIALLLAARERLDVELEVVEMAGWNRSMWFDDTGLPWVMPSPNMPTLDTAIVYPGMCLVEGTELSEGRGTTRPFEIAGAPGLDGLALAERLAAEIDGAVFRPLSFEPTFQKHARTICGGVQIHVTDRERFASTRAGVAFVSAAAALLGEAFQWRTRAYEFVDDICAFDLLAGSAAVREGIEAGAAVAEITAAWPAAEAEFARERAPHLLYP